MENSRRNLLSRRVTKDYAGEKPAFEETTPPDTIKLVKVQSLIDAHLFYTGQVTGESYEWARAGVIVEVKENDVPELLEKRLGKKQCCGQERTKIFQLA